MMNKYVTLSNYCVVMCASEAIGIEHNMIVFLIIDPVKPLRPKP